MKRRDFFKAPLAATAIAGLTPAGLKAFAADAKSATRELYEIRVYRLKPDAKRDLLETYLAKAAIPALNRLGAKPVGVFTEIEPKEGPAVYVLIPYPSMEAFISATARLNADAAYQQAGGTYLQSPKNNPAFERIDSWFLLAFAGMPKLELPDYCREKKARIFEMRTYESHSESKAVKKVEMFNAGEIGAMREVNLGPIFYGQALIGSNLPHLTYMLSGESREAHKEHFKAFGAHPVWQKLKNDPQYADTVSKITSRFLTPTAYSQI